MASDPTCRSTAPRILHIAALCGLGACLAACETLLGFGDEPSLRPTTDANDSGHDASDVAAEEADSSDDGDGQAVDSSLPDQEAAGDVGTEVAPPDAPDSGPDVFGTILFSVGIENQRIRRVVASAGAAYEDLVDPIRTANPPLDPDASVPYPVRRALLSRDGEYVSLLSTWWSAQDEYAYVLSTDDWQKQPITVAELGGPGTSGMPRLPTLVVSGGLSAVYGHPVPATWETGGNAISLFRTTRTAVTQTSWAAPLRLFPESFEMQSHVIGDVSATSSRVVSACGNEPGVVESSQAICESDFSGASPLATVVVNASAVAVSHPVRFVHPVYDAQDNVLFSANWTEGSPNLDQVWRALRGGGKPERVSPAGREDRSPCVLPDGRIASVFDDGDYQKIRVMTSDGEELFVLETGAEAYEHVAVELGLSCSE